MKDLYEVMRQKKMEAMQLAKEISALELVAPMLADDNPTTSTVTKPPEKPVKSWP